MGFDAYLWCVGLEDPFRTFPRVSPGYSSYVGSLAEMIFMTGVPVDITQASVHARIIDPDTLLPVPIDAAGTRFSRRILALPSPPARLRRLFFFCKNRWTGCGTKAREGSGTQTAPGPMAGCGGGAAPRCGG
jgi:hypothetical protein